MDRKALENLTKEELVELILKLQRPGKTSRTSSKPPSTDRKAKRENSKPGGAKAGHQGHTRQLSETPDKIVLHRPEQCSGCGAAFASDAPGEVVGAYDAIDLPPIQPVVERHERLSLTCACCGLKTKAAVPAAAGGSPFGPGIVSLVVYLKHFQMASYERLQGLLLDVTGLEVSQGALMNMLARAEKAFEEDYDTILARLRQAEAVASDETGMRIEGVNGQQWVFISKDAVVHEASFSRAAQVAKDIMAGHTPKFWTSDRYSAQQSHGEKHQTCLAHLARDRVPTAFSRSEKPWGPDIARVLQVGEEAVGLRLKTWMTDVFIFAKGVKDFAQSTVEKKTKALAERIDDILKTTSACDVTRRVLQKMRNARDQLLTFIERSDLVEPTNNASERALRISVITRKVTNGFRAMWAAQADAVIRTVVDTNRLNGATPYKTIRAVLTR